MKIVQLIKKYVPIFGLPLLAAAVFFLLLRPAYLSLNQIKKEIIAGQIDLQESQAIAAGETEILTVLQKTQEKNAFYQVYFSFLGETDIFRRMAKIANRANICYTKLAPGTGENKKEVTSAPPQAVTPVSNTQEQAPSAIFDIRFYTLTFKASYTQFSNVLTQLAKLDRFVTVRSFKIDTKAGKGNPQSYNPEAELTIDFYFRPGKIETVKLEPQKTLPAFGTQGQAPTTKAEPKKTAATVQPGGTQYYTVCPGDTLIRIARKHGMNIRELRKMNNIPKENLIRPGDKIMVK